MHTDISSRYRCIIYDGSQCTSVFGQANITDFSNSPVGIVYIVDNTVRQGRMLFSTITSQNCVNHLLSILCVSSFSPCTGSAWCGPNSKDALKNAVANACMCDNADSCVINGYNVSLAIDSANYYEGSSMTGAIGNSNVTCQDVTVGKGNSHSRTHHHVNRQVYLAVMCETHCSCSKYWKGTCIHIAILVLFHGIHLHESLFS